MLYCFSAFNEAFFLFLPAMTFDSIVNLKNHVVDFTVMKHGLQLPVEPCLLGISNGKANPVLRVILNGRDEKFFLFHHVISGKADFVSGDIRCHLQAGEAIMDCSSAGWECLPVSRADSFCSLFYVIRGDAALSLGEKITEKHGSMTIVKPPSASLEMLCAHLEKLHAENSWNAMDECAFAYRFLLSLLQEQEQTAQSSDTDLSVSQESCDNDGIPENLRRATEYVEAHLADTMLNVETIAKVAGLSKFHFIRIFEKAYGISPWKYLLSQRLFRAAQLMAQDKSLPLKLIIQQCGFASETYFCRAFRKTYHRSPGSHKRLLKNPIPETL